MNETNETILTAEQAEALYEAERIGMRQIRGLLRDGSGAVCALGAIQRLLGPRALKALTESRGVVACPVCGVTSWCPDGSEDSRKRIVDRYELIAHVNDDHGLTFSEIARKLGPDAA